MNHAKRNPGIPKRPNPQKNAKVVLGTSCQDSRLPRDRPQSSMSCVAAISLSDVSFELNPWRTFTERFHSVHLGLIMRIVNNI